MFTGLMLNVAYSQTKVLFIGNSYTGVNNLPQLTYDVALSTNDTLIMDFHTPGGTRLMNHASSPQAISKIYSNDWDYVVLQAQSQEPSWPIQQVQTEVFKYATILCDTIRANNSCTMPVFYMTWGRKNGDASNCPNWPPVCTYQGMDSLLNERYQTMGEDNDAFVSPVGAVWHYIRDNYPGIELYSADESHPSLEGSYVAACTFYTVFLRKDPTQIMFTAGIDPVMADDIKASVKAIVYDNLMSWNVGEYDPISDFTFTNNDPSVTFSNQSTNALSFLWDFDDGSTSTNENPQHTYATLGSYSVSLEVEKCGMYDTITQTIEITSVGINEIGDSYDFTIAPNPAHVVVNIKGSEISKIQTIKIYDVSGKLFYSGDDNTSLDISALPKGQYLVKISLANHDEVIKTLIKH